MHFNRGGWSLPYNLFVPDDTVLSTCPLHTISGSGGERAAYIIWSMVMPKRRPLLELPCGLLALCRWTLGSERHRYAIP